MHDDRDRTLHVIDIETLRRLDEGPLDGRAATALFRRYRSTVTVGPRDLAIVGCGPAAALDVGLAVRPARLLVRSGRRGPSSALLDALDPAAVSARFERVVIASSSPGFACMIQRLRGRGVEVRVVSLCDRVANDLRVAGAPIEMLVRSTVPGPAVELAATA